MHTIGGDWCQGKISVVYQLKEKQMRPCSETLSTRSPCVRGEMECTDSAVTFPSKMVALFRRVARYINAHQVAPDSLNTWLLFSYQCHCQYEGKSFRKYFHSSEMTCSLAGFHLSGGGDHRVEWGYYVAGTQSKIRLPEPGHLRSGEKCLLTGTRLQQTRLPRPVHDSTRLFQPLPDSTLSEQTRVLG